MNEQFKLFAILENNNITFKVLEFRNEFRNGNSYKNNFDFDKMKGKAKTFRACDDIQEVFDPFKEDFDDSNFSLDIN